MSNFVSKHMETKLQGGKKFKEIYWLELGFTCMGYIHDKVWTLIGLTLTETWVKHGKHGWILHKMAKQYKIGERMKPPG